MELKQCFHRVMSESINMALATSTDSRPNVRIVTFGYDEQQADRLYFCTFRGNRKIQEFAKNPQVACTPLPAGPETQCQVRIFGTVRPSARTLQELIGLISKKAPQDADTLRDSGDLLELYEICFAEAWVTVGMSDARRYRIG